MKTVNVEIESLGSMLIHKMPMGKDREEMAQTIKVLTKNPDDEQAYAKEAELSLYRNKKGLIYIPSIWLESTLTKAGTSQKVKGGNQKTYKDYMKAFVIIDPEEIVIQPQTYETDRRWVRVKGSRILRTRPRIDDWKAAFKMTVTDDTIPMMTVKEILDYAGAYIGIGDWRPKFGRFKVTKFAEA